MNFSMSKNSVDTHFHVFNAGQAVDGARYVPQYSAPLSDWVHQAHSAGVTRGVWVQPSFLGTNNSLMVSALKAHPDMLRGVAVVRPDVRADELCALHAAGVRGIRLNLAGISHEISEWTHADTVWQTLSTLGWHLELHTDQGGLPKVLAQLPSELALVVDHMAKPVSAHASDPSFAALIRHAKKSATHVKLSGAYRLGEVDAATAAQVLLHELGPSALLWGSDWPCTNHEHHAHLGKLIQQAHEWVAPEIMERVLNVNPSNLYWGQV